tara:strand:- start:80 stop:541 length:462 start_codon:yes stop_codon:yes gene_type:complete
MDYKSLYEQQLKENASLKLFKEQAEENCSSYAVMDNFMDEICELQSQVEHLTNTLKRIRKANDIMVAKKDEDDKYYWLNIRKSAAYQFLQQEMDTDIYSYCCECNTYMNCEEMAKNDNDDNREVFTDDNTFCNCEGEICSDCWDNHEDNPDNM